MLALRPLGAPETTKVSPILPPVRKYAATVREFRGRIVDKYLDAPTLKADTGRTVPRGLRPAGRPRDPSKEASHGQRNDGRQAA